MAEKKAKAKPSKSRLVVKDLKVSAKDAKRVKGGYTPRAKI
jgi:hypothetical protein